MLSFLKKNFQKTLLTASYEDLYQYFAKINAEEIKKGAKINIYAAINKYYKIVETATKRSEKPFKSQMPELDEIEFSESEQSIDDFIDKLMDDEVVMKIDDGIKLLKHFFFNGSLMMFIYSLISFVSGGRVIEVISTKIKSSNLKSQLNLEERYIINRVKSRKHKRIGVLFFPEWAVFFIKNWLDHLKLKYPQTKYLFPSPWTSRKTHISYNWVEDQLKEAVRILDLKAECNTHAWRNMINEFRESIGITPERRMLLINQTPPGGVNSASYLKSLKYIRKLRLIYDKSTPIKEPEFLRRYRIMSKE